MNLSSPLEDVRRLLEKKIEDIRGKLYEPWFRPTAVTYDYYKNVLLVLTKTKDKYVYLQIGPLSYVLPDSTHQNIEMELHASFKGPPCFPRNRDSIMVTDDILECRKDVNSTGSNLFYKGPQLICNVSFKNVEKKNIKREFYVVQITKGHEYHDYEHKYCSWRCVSEVLSGREYSLDNDGDAYPWYSEDSCYVMDVGKDGSVNIKLKDVPETDIPKVVENKQLLAARRSQEFFDFIMMRVSGEEFETKEYLIHSFKWFLHFDWKQGGLENHDYGITVNDEVTLDSIRKAMKYPNINDNQLYYSICKSNGTFKIEREPKKMTRQYHQRYFANWCVILS